MISRIILLAAIAIISVAAYFAGSGAFKPYSAKLFDLFSQRTASAPASLPKETLAAAATNSDHDQLPTPNDFSRSPERPLAETQTQTPVAAAKSMAAPQTTASLSKEALATAGTNFDHDQLPAPNDLSHSPGPLVDTHTPCCSGQIDCRPPSDRVSSQRRSGDSGDDLRARQGIGAKRFKPLARTSCRGDADGNPSGNG